MVRVVSARDFHLSGTLFFSTWVESNGSSLLYAGTLSVRSSRKCLLTIINLLPNFWETSARREKWMMNSFKTFGVNTNRTSILNSTPITFYQLLKPFLLHLTKYFRKNTSTLDTEANSDTGTIRSIYYNANIIRGISLSEDDLRATNWTIWIWTIVLFWKFQHSSI